MNTTNDDGYMEITVADALIEPVQAKVREISYNVKQSKLSDRSIRVNTVTAAFINDANRICNVKSKTKTASALLWLGFTKFHDAIGDSGLDAIDIAIANFDNASTLACFRKYDVCDHAIHTAEIHMAATVFHAEILKICNADKKSVVHWYPVGYVTSALDMLDDLGFSGGVGCDFLTLLAVYGTDYARSLGIDCEIKTIVDATLEKITEVARFG